jgi:uncharacterized repeat protein (TIGR01451 family)
MVANPTPYVVVGNALVYTISVTNTGPLAAVNVVMTDTLDPNETYVSSPGCALNTTTMPYHVECDVANIAAGATATFTITVTAPNTAGITLTESAMVVSDMDDSNMGDNTASLTTLVTLPPDMAVTMSGSPSAVALGGSVTYTINVSVGADAPAAGVTVVSDPLPAGLVYGSCTPAPSTTCQYDPPSRKVTYNVGAMVASSTATLGLTVNVPSTYSGATSFTNTVTVYPLDTATPGDNVASVTTQIIDLQLNSFSGSPSSVAVGQDVTYTIQVSNPSGGPDAPNVTVTQTYPSSFTFVSASSTAGCSAGAGTATCTLGALSAGGTATVTLVFTVPSPYTGANPFTSTASVTPSDPTPGDNSATFTTTVLQPDLSITGISGTVQAGSNSNGGNNLTYTFTVTNGGTADASAIQISTTLPTSFTYSSGANAGWTQNGVNLTYSIGSLAQGASVTKTLVLGVLQDYNVVATPTLTIQVTPSDNNPSNNTATISTTVTAPQIWGFSGTCASHGGGGKYDFTFSWSSYPSLWGATQFKITTPFSGANATWTISGGTQTSSGGSIPNGGVSTTSGSKTFTITAWTASAAISGSPSANLTVDCP